MGSEEKCKAATSGRGDWFTAMIKSQISNLIFQISIALLAHATAAQMAMAAPLAVPVTGKPFHAELGAVDADWRLTFQVEKQQYVMRATDLVCWGQCPEQGRAGGLVLADGSWLAAEPLTADEETLTANSELFGALKIPLGALAGVVFRSSSDPSQRDMLYNHLVGATGQSDRLLLDNGDELSGRFLALADDTVQFQTDVGPIDVKADRITALIFQRSENRQPNGSAKPFRAWAAFRDGARLLATRLATEGDTLNITAAGQPFAVSQEQLVFLQPLGGRAIYLSDLKPTEYRQTPYVGRPPSAVADCPSLAWPYHADRNVTGGFLRCGGQLYSKGLGVHSASRLVYQLSPVPSVRGRSGRRAAIQRISPEGSGVRANRFEAELGIDDSTAGRGSVQFRVLVDGRERYVSPIIRGSQPPMPVSVDIRGARKLELVVDYADRADVLDHADWLNARLTK